MSNPDFQNGFVAGYSVGRASSTPSGQVDYIQNDSTAKDYIKNRPFYDAYVPLDIELSAQDSAVSVKGSLGLIPGNIYTVFDGVNTIEIEAVDLTELLGFGAVGFESANFTLFDKVYFVEDTRDILYNPEYYAYISGTSLKITGEVYYLKPLDDKFLSDNVVTNEKLVDFKNEYIDYTALYMYESDKLSKIMVTPQYPCFKMYTEVVNVYSGYTVVGKAIWVEFDIVLAKMTNTGELVQLLESPLNIEYANGKFECTNYKSIKDTFIIVDGEMFTIGEAFSDMVDGEIILGADIDCNVWSFLDSTSNDTVCLLRIIQDLRVVLGDIDGVPVCDIVKQEIDAAFESYDGLAGLVYINTPKYDLVKAQYLGGND
jgi:hypothetical protein